MKKNIYNIIIGIAISIPIFTFNSCSRFIDDIPVTSLTPGNAYKSASDRENE
jgi:hypothetical protein